MKLERSVPHGKYQKVTLGASDLLSFVNGSRLIPQRSENNANGYTPSSITVSSDPLSLNRNVVIDAEEETTAFRFIESFPRFMQITYN